MDNATNPVTTTPAAPAAEAKPVAAVPVSLPQTAPSSSPPPDSNHMPVQAPPDGNALTGPKDAPSAPKPAAPLQGRPGSEKPKTQTKVIVATILVMLVLSAIAMLAYMNSRA